MSTAFWFVALAMSPLLAQPPLFPNARQATGRAPAFVAVADLDQDSHLDAVATNPSTGDVTTLLGDGAGGLAVLGHFVCGAGPLGTVLADFDGDGKIDALIPRGTAGVLALLSGDGAGGFAAPSTIAVGHPFGSFTAADIDLDGDLDLVVGDSVGAASGLTALLANGAGGFAVQVSTTQAPIRTLTLADVTGDGIPDALCLNEDSNFILTTYAGDGSGGFSYSMTHYVSPHVGSMIVAGDFDSDGDTDAAVLYLIVPGPSAAFLVLNNDGHGALTQGTTYNLFTGAQRAISIGDVDDDGALDLVSYATTNSWIRGSGNGTFSAARTLPGSGAGIVVDLDDDGSTELLTVIDSPIPSLGVVKKDPLGRIPGVLQSQSTGRTALVDFDSDGDDDLLQFTGGGIAGMVVARNDGFGNFNDGPPIAVPLEYTGFPQGPRIGDFDNDGRADVLVWYGINDDQLMVGLGNGAGDVAAWKSSPIETGSFVFHFAGEVGDFDQDGRADFADGRQYGLNPGKLTIEIRPGLGDGTLLPLAASLSLWNVSWGAEVRPFTVADVDIDGRADLVCADSVGFGIAAPLLVTTVRSTGAFQFTIPDSKLIGTGMSKRVEAGDLDRDGVPDFAITHSNASGPHLLLVWGNVMGGGTLMSAPPVEPNLDENSDVAIADVDADGGNDLVVTRPSQSRIAVLRNASAGGFTFSSPEAFQIATAYGLDVHPGDLDGDGRIDLISQSASVLLQPTPAAPCAGGFTKYGAGCFGASYFVPNLAGTGCPTPGGTLAITLTKAPGPPTGSVALLFAGGGPASMPLGYGCNLFVYPIVVGPLVIPLSGSGPGSGGFSIFAELPVSTPTGTSLSLQVFAPHSSVPWGYASSNGLRFDVQ